MNPVGKMSERNKTFSSGRSLSIFRGPTFAKGTRTYCAWPPAHPSCANSQRDPSRTINGLHEVCIRISVVTGGPDLFPAKLALAAGDCEGHNYAVPTLEVVNFFTHFFDDVHEFVTENVPFFHGGDEAVKQM